MGAAFSAERDPGPKQYAKDFQRHPDLIILPTMALTVLLYLSTSLLIKDIFSSPLLRVSRYIQTNFSKRFIPAYSGTIDSPSESEGGGGRRDRWFMTRLIYATFALVAAFTIGQMGIFERSNVAGCSTILTLAMIFEYLARFLILAKLALELQWRGIRRAETVLISALLFPGFGISLLITVFTSTGTLTKIFVKELNMAICPPSPSISSLLPPMAFLIPSVYFTLRHYLDIRNSARAQTRSAEGEREEEHVLSDLEVKKAGLLCAIGAEMVAWIAMTAAQEAGAGNLVAFWVPWVFGAVVIILTLDQHRRMRNQPSTSPDKRRRVSIVTTEKGIRRNTAGSAEIDRMFDTPANTDRSHSNNGVSRTSIDSGQFSIVNPNAPPMPVQVAPPRRPPVARAIANPSEEDEEQSLVGHPARAQRHSTINSASSTASETVTRLLRKISDVPPRIPSLMVGEKYRSLSDVDDRENARKSVPDFMSSEPSATGRLRESTRSRAFSPQSHRTGGTSNFAFSLSAPETITPSASPTGSEWTSVRPQFPSMNGSRSDSRTFGTRTVPSSPTPSHHSLDMPPPAPRGSDFAHGSPVIPAPRTKPPPAWRPQGLPANPRRPSIDAGQGFI